MGQVVWFFGPTAVGKDTLIKGLAGDVDHPLRRELGLRHDVIVSQEALDLRHDERIGLAKKLATFAQPGKTLLLKGQGADLKHQNPHQLNDLLPNYEHLLVFVDADPATITKRRHMRGNPPDPWDDEHDRRINLQNADVLRSTTGLPCVWIDNRDVPRKVAESELHK